MPLAYIALGSNLGDCAAHLRTAIEALAQLGSVRAQSSLYRSAPWGKTDQPEFVNAVALLETDLSPAALLGALKSIEKRLGRIDAERWGPRVIDLDIITYDDAIVDTEELRIPHPRFRERAFVLVPLAEIDPSYAELRDALSPRERRGVVSLA